jgi:cobalt/nickel transport system permease protein
MTGPASPSSAGSDPRCLIVALVACIVVTVLTPTGYWLRLGGEAAIVCGLLALLRTPARWLLGRLALLLPFLLLAAISVPFMRAAPGHAAPLERAGAVVARTLISSGALIAVLQATGPAALLEALGRLRVPAIFITLMALMMRYLGVLEDEASRMMRARSLRGTPPTVRARAAVAGAMVGSLLVRSVERAERVSLAMQARGFTGLLPQPPPRPLRRIDVTCLAVFLLLQALLLALR